MPNEIAIHQKQLKWSGCKQSKSTVQSSTMRNPYRIFGYECFQWSWIQNSPRTYKIKCQFYLIVHSSMHQCSCILKSFCRTIDCSPFKFLWTGLAIQNHTVYILILCRTIRKYSCAMQVLFVCTQKITYHNLPSRKQSSSVKWSRRL